MTAKKIKAWSWKTIHSKPHCFKLPTEFSASANPPERRQPQRLIDSSRRRCISANWHPASIRRSKGHLRHIWPIHKSGQKVIIKEIAVRKGL
jgi:hypothetical protein